MQAIRFDTKFISRAAVIAALYAAMTYLAGLFNLAYGPVQFRFSEALTLLPFLLPEAVPGLFAGCLLSNLLSPYGPLDVVVGTLATLLAAAWTAKCRSRAAAALPPVLCNAVLVGGMIAWYEAGFGPGFVPAFLWNGFTVALGEAVVCYALGLPMLRVLERRGIAGPAARSE